jgi:O-succinylbenzoic acid--CoA ligase
MSRLVPLALPGGPGYLDALRRAWADGDVVLPLDPRSPEPHRAAVLRTAADARLRPGDAVVIATSGTTGAPRLVVHTHDAIEAAAHMSADALGVEPDTVWLACLPLWHVGGFSVLARALHTGTALLVHDGFDAEKVELAARQGATHVSLVPTALARTDWRPWRRILLGGSAVPRDRPPNTVATYGMTETFGGVVYDGLPLPGVELRLDGPDGTTGRIRLRTPTLGRPLYGGRLHDADGWFTTGDVGHLDSDGRLVVDGRVDDVVVSGGEKIWPEPVERRLEAHPQVFQAAVVGADDPEWGQRVVAVVVPVDPTDPPELEALRDWVRREMPAPCAPRELRMVDTLPRTSLGKLARRSLCDWR